ncbi:MAG: CPBP family intramembrane metalloprotease [Sediminibacterium sp.]|nr:CPBP family intramembrane metalloprotease [Sediminibacterium sp.]
MEENTEHTPQRLPFNNLFLLSGRLNGENKPWMYFFGILMLVTGYLIIGGLMFIPLMQRATEMGISLQEINENNYIIFDAERLNIDKFYILIAQFSIFVFAFLGLYVVIKFIHKKKLLHVITGFDRFRFNRFWFSFLIWGGLLCGAMLIGYFIEPGSLTVQFNLQRFLVLILVCAIFLPIQTLTEELVFRGYLLQGFSQIFKNGWVPLLITSALFTLAHMSNPEVGKYGWGIMSCYYAGFALFLGALTLLDEGLELAYGIHFANNFFSSLLVTSPHSVIKTDALFYANTESAAAELVLALCLALVSFIVFWLKYRWKNTNLLLK